MDSENDPIVQPQTDQTDNLAQDVREIKQSIVEMKEQLAAQASAAETPVDQKKKEGREQSKGLLTLAFAAIGGKLGFLVGSHVAFGKTVMRESKGASRAEIANKMAESASKLLHPTPELIKSMAKETAIGATIGLAAGAWLGMARGSRIDSPEKLLTDPINSLQKIFAPDDKSPDDEPQAKKNWTEKVAADTKDKAAANTPPM